MADIGYTVDTNQAEDYELPEQAAAKMVAGQHYERFCEPMKVTPRASHR